MPDAAVAVGVLPAVKRHIKRDWVRQIIGSSSLLVHPTESGSTYPKENKAVDRMSGTTGQAFTKSVDTVSIWLKSGGLLLFCPSSCTKSDTAGEFISYGQRSRLKGQVGVGFRGIKTWHLV